MTGISTTLVDDSTSSKAVEVTFQAVFADGGEVKLSEYLAQLEKETGAVNIHLLSH